MKSDFIWMDGALVPFEKATVPLITPTLHYGVGVFEGIRCYSTSRGPAVFRLKEHMERLAASAQVLGFRNLTYSATQLSEAAKLTVSANGFFLNAANRKAG